MEIKDIVSLMQYMNDYGIDSLSLEHDGLNLKLKRNGTAVTDQTIRPAAVTHTDDPQARPPVAALFRGDKAEAGPASPDTAADELPGELVTAPVVGVFFSAPSPEAASFVEVGSEVKKGDVICIIEAMKLMNEVASTISGRILEVYASNGQKVQYGDPLFRIG